MTGKENLQDQIVRKDRSSALVVLPVYNEEKALRQSVKTLTSFLSDYDRYNWKIVIADNNSQDSTGEIGRELEKENPIVQYLHIPRKGRGIALRTAWEQTDCDFVSYMDIDLSTGLDALIRAVDLLNKGADIVVGNRLDKTSNVKRCLKREFVSRSYNLVIKTALGTHFQDAHCGFKTGRREVVQKILPYIEDNEWFFDTEFLFYGEKLGHGIVEIPVTWVEDQDTKAKIFKDAYDDLRGLYRLRFHNNLDKPGEKT
ncbi:MAG TPA: glycosyltransferase [Nitrospirae bacterium]|nr:undecaprenyl-phosphate mannosyltransferase [bacterium BMS3Abin06]HDH12749.1 glycosyltransferase [Nitrospirota bacterium]HDZ00058.1 glycosyltransferase [Nitrospirota bacterium]